MGLFKKSKKENNSCCCGNVDNLILKEGNEKDTDCGCGCDSACAQNTSAENKNEGVTIKILGSGCKNCVTLYENVNVALKELNMAAEVIKVTDFAEITGYGVMSTPALVVNEKVVSYGKVLKAEEVKKILQKVAM